MQIYGTTHVHSAQPLASPHRLGPTQAARPAAADYGVDQLDLSPEAELAAQVRDLPEIREDRVAAIRAQIASGTYETPEKLDIALSRLLDEIA
jgi:negative regulator of flagellin synthesis FlgM